MEIRIMWRVSLLLVLLLQMATATEIESSDVPGVASRVSRAAEVAWDRIYNYYDSILTAVTDQLGYKPNPSILPGHSIHPSSQPPIYGLTKQYPTTLFTGTAAQQLSCGDIFLGQCDRKSRYRTIDGSCNNLLNTTWGMSGTRYARLLPAIYSDGVHAPARSSSNRELPPPRVVSFTLFPDVKNPDRQLTLAAMQWGQVVAHDMALAAGATMARPGVTPCCSMKGVLIPLLLGTDQCLPIVIPWNDPDYRGVQCVPFIRSATDLDSGCPVRRQPAEQLTTTTHFLDLSLVYGSTDQIAQQLRARVGGRLNVNVRTNREWLPPAAIKLGTCMPSIQKVCYAAGDERVNQNTQLTVLHIILMREHNRMAGKLALLNPHWSDETIYQETRRIMIAAHQQITYYEWLPAFIGVENSYKHKIIYGTDGYVDDYDPNVNPSVLNEHSSAAFRSFHSLIAGYLKLVTEQRSSRGALRLSDWFFAPGIIELNNNMDDLTRGLSDQPQESQDEYFDKEITLYFNRGGRLFGQDLRSIDIQRNRDHGLATYNDFREYCGMPRANSWNDLESVMDPVNIEKLSRLYENPSDVDLTVGGSLERLVQGTLAGPTFLCILTEQFYRTRVGDRFWFESPNPDVAFTIEQLREIRKISLARWFCDDSDRIQNMQRRAFEQPSPTNPLTSCQDIPKIELSPWKDYGPQLAGQAIQSSQYQQQGAVYYKK